MSTTTTSLRYLVRLSVQPERADELAVMLAASVAAVRAEPGCLQFEATRCLEDRSVFVLLEEWASQQAFDQHHALPEQQQRMAALGAILVAPPALTRLETLGPR